MLLLWISALIVIATGALEPKLATAAGGAPPAVPPAPAAPVIRPVQQALPSTVMTDKGLGVHCSDNPERTVSFDQIEERFSFLLLNHMPNDLTIFSVTGSDRFFGAQRAKSWASVSIEAATTNEGVGRMSSPVSGENAQAASSWTPWNMPPGKGGFITISMKTPAKVGTFSETVTLHTDRGVRILRMRMKVEPLYE